MLSKSKIKFIRSLGIKKNRDKENVFLAEGSKNVDDILTTTKPILIVSTNVWKPQKKLPDDIEWIIVDKETFAKISILQQPSDVLAVFPKYKTNICTKIANELYLALDDVQDPGNLGTIIRIADWFGIKNIICSYNTTDVYNPKVIQSTMGSISRVNVFYTDLYNFIESVPKSFPVYGTLLDGDNIYCKPLTDYGIIVMGNEGHGISPKVRELINRKLFIPRYGNEEVESLNVAIATAVVCSEFKRRC